MPRHSATLYKGYFATVYGGTTGELDEAVRVCILIEIGKENGF